MRKQPRLRAERLRPASNLGAHAGSARSLGHDQVVHARLRTMVAQTLVVLHVDDPHHLSVHLRDQRDAVQPAEVTAELHPVGGVFRRARGHAAPQLHEQRGDRGPILGPGETHRDRGTVHRTGQKKNGHHGSAPARTR